MKKREYRELVHSITALSECLTGIEDNIYRNKELTDEYLTIAKEVIYDLSDFIEYEMDDEYHLTSAVINRDVQIQLKKLFNFLRRKKKSHK